jgi:hypothetical protein
MNANQAISYIIQLVLNVILDNTLMSSLKIALNVRSIIVIIVMRIQMNASNAYQIIISMEQLVN